MAPGGQRCDTFRALGAWMRDERRVARAAVAEADPARAGGYDARTAALAESAC
jgi:hypothetical protein